MNQEALSGIDNKFRNALENEIVFAKNGNIHTTISCNTTGWFNGRFNLIMNDQLLLIFVHFKDLK